MTEPITKPDHHRVPVEDVRAWRTATGVDTQMSICLYCDEDIKKTEQLRCSHSCGTYSVWVDTSTLAQITLELS